MTPPPSGPEPGTTLAGKYLVERVLGVGGMGVVVAAQHLQLDQRVAIKYLLPDALQSPEVVERFAREARAAAKIRGEHVARVIDVGQFPDGSPFMVLEYLEGHDLSKELETRGPLPVADVARYMLETCEALAEAHAAKIVHRDLKPSNLFLADQPDKRAIIKVLDFGISKTGDAPTAALTKTSALMGTAFYMSPEQLIAPKTVDHRSDIWSLGVILYELLAGRPPFTGESVPEIIGGILTNAPEPLASVRGDLPPGVYDLVAKCMQSKAPDRYQSVAALAAALGPFASDRDRASVEITARVLGEIHERRPSNKPASTVVLPSNPTNPAAGGVPATGPVPGPPASSPAISSSGAVSSPGGPPSSPGFESSVAATTGSTSGSVASAAIGLTANGLSSSTITQPARRTPWLPVAAGVIVVGLLAGGLFAKMGPSGSSGGSSTAGAALVATATDPTPSAAVAAAAASSGAAPATSTAPAEPASQGPTTAASAASTTTAAVPTPAGAAAASAKVGARTTTPPRGPSAAASAPRPPASAPAAPAPASAAPATPAPPKNPLQMDVK